MTHEGFPGVVLGLVADGLKSCSIVNKASIADQARAALDGDPQKFIRLIKRYELRRRFPADHALSIQPLERLQDLPARFQELGGRAWLLSMTGAGHQNLQLKAAILPLGPGWAERARTMDEALR